MLHPNTEIRFINPAKGYGVVATTYIPKGTITWVMDALDRTITPEEAAKITGPMKDMLEKYSYRNGQGNHVLCWDHTKYMNHSFNPNCVLTPLNFEIAVRDIMPGEELTNDYGFLNLPEPFNVAHEKGTKRTAVGPEDILLQYKIWDRKIKASAKMISTVEQPLQAYFSEEHWEQTMKVATGKAKMPSIMHLYYDPNRPTNIVLRIA